MRYRAIILGVTAAMAAAAPAFANHGKVGLWNVSSTMEVTIPANPVAGKKAPPPMLMPQMPPVNVQICMSQEDVASNAPPRLDRGASGCTTKVVSQTADFLRATMICKGRLKGTGAIEVYYKGAEHYSGAYSFNGASGSQPMNMKTNFKGDWLKADCGKVRPFKPRTP